MEGESKDGSDARLSFEKIFYHPVPLRQFLVTGDCFPIHMTIGFTNYCSERCLWCNCEYENRSGKKHSISPEVLIGFLGDAAKAGLKSVSIVGSGEPLLHPQASELLYGIGKTGIKQGMYSCTTNDMTDRAQAILDNLTFFRTSLDSATAETHRKVHRRGGNGFENAVKNLEYLVAHRKGKFPTLGIQFVTSQYNVHEAVMAVKLAKDLGVNYIAYKPMMRNPLNPDQDRNMLAYDGALKDLFDELRTYSGDGFKVYAKEEQFAEVLGNEWNDGRNYDKCLGHYFSPSLNAEGVFYMCVGMEGRAEFELGNIYDAGFKELWYGKRRKEAIASIDLGKCPSGCRQDPLNKILFGLTLEEAERRIAMAGVPDLEMHPDFL